MNLFSLSRHYIRQNLLNTFLNVLLLGLGIGVIVFLMLVQSQLEDKFRNDVKGIKMVVGAKGSPLQIILCAVYHIDNPTGNIPLAEVQKIVGNKRFVKKAIPLALGDNYKNYRIVGTDKTLSQHYGAKIAQGRLFEKVMEVCLGSKVAQETGLKIGDTFKSSHGLQQDEEMDFAHEEHVFKVVGIFNPSFSVLDKLILTGIPSFWLVHEQHQEEEEDSENTEDTTHQHLEEEKLPNLWTMPAEDKEITALLITEYQNPMAAITLPRMISQIGALQAASPALEVSRLFEQIGIGQQIAQVFGFILIGIAVLSTFIALYNALKARRYDLAVMRSLGASRFKLFRMMLLEGCFLALLGGFLGLLLGHLAVEIAGQQASVMDKLYLTGKVFLIEECWLLALVLGVGVLASIIPAWQSYRTEIAEVLAKG
jgi:putative ABC transport system permease protein